MLRVHSPLVRKGEPLAPGGPVRTIEIDPPADPLALYRAFVANGRRRPFLLESAGRPGFAGGRYSIAGHGPIAEIECRGKRATLRDAGGGVRVIEADPFSLLRETLARHRLPAAACGDLPMGGGGMVACLGYGLSRFIERLPRTAVDDSRFGDLHAAVYDAVVVIDHLDGRAFVTASGEGRRRTDELREEARSAASVAAGAVRASGLTSNFSRAGYERAVARAREYIAAGDIFQVNLSQRFECGFDGRAEDLYAAVRSASPAPFAALVPLDDDRTVISDSPERFLRLRERRVETRPIKGTRRRGADPREDAALAGELMRSEKDAAELAMIVDLERNDLGRVCAYGSVAVTEPGALESHPTVHHRVAAVEGTLRAGADAIDLLRAAFPGGSITGAPKIRAMEIIDELEPTARKIYTGAIGWFGFGGNIDLNIAIRTLTLESGRARFQAGGGIVADSDPAGEYVETLHKARALVTALGLEGDWPPPGGARSCSATRKGGIGGHGPAFSATRQGGIGSLEHGEGRDKKRGLVAPGESRDKLAAGPAGPGGAAP